MMSPKILPSLESPQPPPTLGQSLWCTVPIIVEQIPSLSTPAVFDRKTLDYSLQSNLIGLMIQYGTKH